MVRFQAGHSRTVPFQYHQTGIYPLSVTTTDDCQVVAGPRCRVKGSDLSPREALGQHRNQIAFGHWPANQNRESHHPVTFPLNLARLEQADHAWWLTGERQAHLLLQKTEGVFYYGGLKRVSNGQAADELMERVYKLQRDLAELRQDRDEVIGEWLDGKVSKHQGLLDEIRIDTNSRLEEGNLFFWLEKMGKLGQLQGYVGQAIVPASDVNEMSEEAQRALAGAWVMMEHERLQSEWVREQDLLAEGVRRTKAKFQPAIDKLTDALFEARWKAVGATSGHDELIARLHQIQRDPSAEVFPIKLADYSSVWTKLRPTAVVPGDVITLDPRVAFGSPRTFSGLAIMLPDQNIVRTTRPRVEVRDVSLAPPMEEMRGSSPWLDYAPELLTFKQYREVDVRYASAGEPARVSASVFAGGHMRDSVIASRIQIGNVADKVDLFDAAIVYNVGPHALRIGPSEENALVVETGTAAVVAPAMQYDTPQPAASLWPASESPSGVIVAQNPNS